jgi:hypothetical protein
LFLGQLSPLGVQLSLFSPLSLYKVAPLLLRQIRIQHLVHGDVPTPAASVGPPLHNGGSGLVGSVGFPFHAVLFALLPLRGGLFLGTGAGDTTTRLIVQQVG